MLAQGAETTIRSARDRKVDDASSAISQSNGVYSDIQFTENGFESSKPRYLSQMSPSISVLGVPVSLLTMEAAVTNIMGYIAKR